MLNDRLKNQVRARIEKHLTQTCVIRRREYATDSYGNEVEFARTQITSACFLTVLRRYAGNRVAAEDLGRVYYTLHLPYDTDIQDNDEVEVDGDTTVYRVEQAIRSQGVDVMRQAIVVKAGS